MKFKDYSFKKAAEYIFNFFKWIFLACVTGAVGGLVGSAFHLSIEYVTGIREKYTWVIYFLPLGGIVIAFLYKICRLDKNGGTDFIISSVREKEKVPLLLAPLIFVSTVITHLCGGSAGREGAALQLGGTIGSQVGSVFRLGEKDMHLIIMCGMSGVFSALFGTPLTATVFAMEVISVGVVYYSSLVPSLTSSLVAYAVSRLFKIAPVAFKLSQIPQIGVKSLLKAVVLATVCAVVSIVFCILMHLGHTYLPKLIKNSFLRAAAGGTLIILLTLLVGNYDYNGAGMNIIENAINGSAVPYAFLLKMIFTVITISCGYKGGEIVPTFFIGATLGCAVGPLLGLPAGFSAALGLVALFCSVVNCPIASMILSVEMFGSEGFVFFGVVCAVSYVLSGYYSLYGTQKIMYSKVKAEYININAW
ncbi:MAG: chloride channel protein [Acutalibacteraceae bacterium]|nr:chloride channel protein [Oscillospiraceae bacterium]